jgi:hypothetical protein
VRTRDHTAQADRGGRQEMRVGDGDRTAGKGRSTGNNRRAATHHRGMAASDGDPRCRHQRRR